MPTYQMGRRYDWRLTEETLAMAQHPVLRAAMPPGMRGSGAGKVVLGHKMVKEIAGSYLHIAQEIGDCAAMGGYKATDYMRCAEIKAGEREEFVAMTASEPLYGYARVEISKGVFGADGKDGTSGASIVRALKQGGTVVRKLYRIGDKTYDFRTYSGALARKWGAKKYGVPDELEPTMREHCVNAYSLVTDYEASRDAMWNGYFMFVSSDQGFEDKRDAEGFARPSGIWSHIMTVIGFDDNPRRPGVLIDNSWPVQWITGPTRHEQPPGSFWCDVDIFEKRMLKPDADSYALSGFDGYPIRDELFDIG